MKIWQYAIIAVLIVVLLGVYSGLNRMYRNSQLTLAIKTNNLSLAEKSLKWGANIEFTYTFATYPMTPLAYAIAYGFPEMVQLLLNRGASMQGVKLAWSKLQKDPGSYSALELAEEISRGESDHRWDHKDHSWSSVIKNQKQIISIIKQEMQKRMIK